MTLISKENIDGSEVRYYDGIDFDIIKSHPKDGSGGFIICFVDSWVSEVKKYNRGNKIDTIINNKETNEFDIEEINNNWVCIYQANGMTEQVYETIKKNLHRKVSKPWMTTTDIRGDVDK